MYISRLLNVKVVVKNIQTRNSFRDHYHKSLVSEREFWQIACMSYREKTRSEN